ncbi:MAG: DEAD/DEAH box helicase [Devosia sp.]
MSLERLRSLGGDEQLSSEDVFSSIFDAGAVLAETDRESSDALETAIRLLEAKRNRQLPKGSDGAVDLLAQACGLFPYVDAQDLSLATQTLMEAHSVTLGDKLYLHTKQMQVLLWLLAGDNVILSAPTSFGKSLLVDAFIQKASPHTVVMILPTIALIDECRRRLKRHFGERFRILTTTSDHYSEDEPTVFVLTQERFLQRKDKLRIDLLFVDEFYKLDPSRDDGRFETLNLAVYRALPQAKQCFMAGPHIRDISLGDHWTGNFRFVRTDYRTVTVNIIDRSASGSREEAFLADLRSVGDESSLVFTATPGSAQDLLQAIRDAGINYKSDLGPKLGKWIAKNYHDEWLVAAGADAGIAVHHGRLPRSLGQLFVRLFDAGELKVLICTSTLIEGVNTSAANVFIYDKKINRTDFDFFSFANIRGRVGRMMRHFVGNAFLYHSPPAEVETHVEVPVLSNPEHASDYIVANVERPQLSPAGQTRQDNLASVTGIPLDIIREHGAIGIEALILMRECIFSVLDEDPSLLEWTGYPTKEQRVTLADIVLQVAHARQDSVGIHTAKQVAWAWSQLGSIKTLPGFLHWFVHVFSRGDRRAGLDAAFQFLQACEFSFPRTIGAIQALVALDQTEIAPNYSVFAVGLENWFRPIWMKQLEEAGIPIPLSERITRLVGNSKDRFEALTSLRLSGWESDKDLSEIDRFILAAALE